MTINVGWDKEKARTNLIKHKISFDEASKVFEDPLAVTIPDHDHGGRDERWITVGLGAVDRTLFVVHTWIEFADDDIFVRIISARKATRHETRQYQEDQ